MKAWMLNFAAVLVNAPVAYGITAPQAADIESAVLTFSAALTTATDPATRTAPTIAAKDNARAEALIICRSYAQRINANPAITDEQRTTLGLTVRKTTPTPTPAPTAQPLLGLRSQIPGVANLEYTAPGTVGKAKPPGVIGVELWVAVGVAAAVDPAAAAFRGTVTRSPFRVEFDAADKGRTATVFCRFATRSGPGGVAQVGPWSNPLSFVVN